MFLIPAVVTAIVAIALCPTATVIAVGYASGKDRKKVLILLRPIDPRMRPTPLGREYALRGLFAGARLSYRKCPHTSDEMMNMPEFMDVHRGMTQCP
jgi:hypothetical protein